MVRTNLEALQKLGERFAPLSTKGLTQVPYRIRKRATGTAVLNVDIAKSDLTPFIFSRHSIKYFSIEAAAIRDDSGSFTQAAIDIFDEKDGAGTDLIPLGGDVSNHVVGVFPHIVFPIDFFASNLVSFQASAAAAHAWTVSLIGFLYLEAPI